MNEFLIMALALTGFSANSFAQASAVTTIRGAIDGPDSSNPGSN